MKHHIITFENLEQVKEKITQPAVYWIIFFKKNYYRMVSIDLSKKQTLDAAPGPVNQINFTANLDQTGKTAKITSLLKKQKKPFNIFHREPCQYYNFILS